MPEGQLVKTPFTIEKSADGVTYLSSDPATSTTFVALLTYDVPLGNAFEIEPGNYIFGEYFGTGGVTAGDKITAGLTKCEIKNAAGVEAREFFRGSNAIFGDLGDVRQRPVIKTGVVANSSEKIVVSVVNLGTTLDVSTSNFYLEGNLIYSRI